MKLTPAQTKVVETLKAAGGKMYTGKGRCFPEGLNGTTLKTLETRGLVRYTFESLQVDADGGRTQIGTAWELTAQ